MKVFQIFTAFPQKYQPYNIRLIEGLMRENSLHIQVISENPTEKICNYPVRTLSKYPSLRRVFSKKIKSLLNSIFVKRGLRKVIPLKIFPKYNFIRENKKSIFHFHKVQSIPPPLLDFMIKNKIKYIVSLRGYDITIYPLISSSNNDFVVKVLKHAYKIHSVCESLKIDALRLSNIDANKIKVIYRTPNIEDTITAPVIQKFDNTINIFVLSRIHWKKCVSESLITIKTLKEEGYSIKYNIIGGFQGYENEKLLYLIKSLQLENEVKLWGYMPENEYKLLLKDMHIFWMPSINEGIPNSLYYVLASGFPVIASKTNGIPEVIKNNENGLLFDPYNFNELTQKTKLLISNDSLRICLQANAKKTKLQTLQTEIEGYVALYK